MSNGSNEPALDAALVQNFVGLITEPRLNNAAAMSVLAEHPREALAALDRIEENLNRLRQAVRDAASKRT